MSRPLLASGCTAERARRPPPLHDKLRSVAVLAARSTWRWPLIGSASIASLLGVDLDDLFMLNEGTSQDSVLKDPLGSTVGLTNSAQTLTDKYGYELYGAVTHTSGTNVNPYLFAGQMDDFSNLYFMRNRYYMPSLARFISRDPLGIVGGINMYEYAGDDPIDFSDPEGLLAIGIIGEASLEGGLGSSGSAGASGSVGFGYFSGNGLQNFGSLSSFGPGGPGSTGSAVWRLCGYWRSPLHLKR